MTTIKQTRSNTASLVLCGLFAALTAICSYINIPLGFTPVPMNLATLAVFLAGGLLGKKYGMASIAVYVMMGAVGLPVFAGFQAGAGVLAGPTGGFLAGYIAAAFLAGFFMEIFASRSSALCMIGIFMGQLACYLLGTLWFMFITGTEVLAALPACVIPFIPGDLIKITVSILLIKRLRKNL